MTLEKNITSEVDKIINRTQVKEMIGLSSSQLDRLENNGSFPKRIPIGERRIGWSLKEVAEWLDGRKRQRQSTDKPLGVV